MRNSVRALISYLEHVIQVIGSNLKYLHKHGRHRAAQVYSLALHVLQHESSCMPPQRDSTNKMSNSLLDMADYNQENLHHAVVGAWQSLQHMTLLACLCKLVLHSCELLELFLIHTVC